MYEIKAALGERGISPLIRSQLSAAYPTLEELDIIRVWDYAKERGLDPLTNHISAGYKTQFDGFRTLEILTTIHGYRSIAMATGEYAGQDEPHYGPDKEFDFSGFIVTAPEWISVTVYRMTAGQRHPVTAREYFIENAIIDPTGSLTTHWRNRPIGQLTVRAESQALRKAFSLCDSYTPQEAEGYMSDSPHTAEESRTSIGSPQSLFDAAITAYKNARTKEDLNSASVLYEKINQSDINEDQMQQLVDAFDATITRVMGSEPPSYADA